MKIRDLLTGEPPVASPHGRPPMNPLVDQDALQEGELLEVRFDAVRNKVGMIFELRTALQLRSTNTGVLVATGVRSFAWTAPTRTTDRTAWSVGGSRPRQARDLFRLTLTLWPAPGAQLELSAEQAWFFGGNTQSLAENPPNYLEGSDEDIRAQLPGWDSSFELAWTLGR